MKAKKDMEDLRWVRLFTSSHIPKYLVEQIAKRDYAVDDLYQFMEMNLLKMSKDGPTLNPVFHVWALVDSENLVRGFLWFTIDTLSKDLVIQAYSVDPNYWGTGKAVEKLATHMKELRTKGDLKKIFWITKFPKHSRKFGFKPSDCVLMEYNEEDENGINNDGTAGESVSPKS